MMDQKGIFFYINQLLLTLSDVIAGWNYFHMHNGSHKFSIFYFDGFILVKQSIIFCIF